VDYVEISGRPEFLSSVMELEFNIGTNKRLFVKDGHKHVLVAYNPGYVYVSLAKFDKVAFVAAISDQFGYTIEPSNDPNVLLKALHRRMACSTLVRLLEAQNVEEVVYINYGMKAPITDYSFLDWLGLSNAVREIIVDIGATDTVALSSIMLSQATSSLTEDYDFTNYELFSVWQSVRYPGGRPYGTTRVISRDETSNVLKARIYTNLIHVIKAHVHAFFPATPRTVRVFRRYEQYYYKIHEAIQQEGRGWDEIRTELRLRKNLKCTMADLVTTFETERRKIYGNMKFRGMHLATTMLQARHLLDVAKKEMKVFSGKSNCALRRDQVLMYHVLNNSHGYVAPNGNRCISLARHILAHLFHHVGPAPVAIREVDEETKSDPPTDEVELVSGIAQRVVRDFAEGPDAAFEIAIAEDDDDASEDEQDRLRRFAPVDPAHLAEDVEAHVHIKIEGTRKKRYHTVRKLDGSIWKRSGSREALVEVIISELGVDWREFLQARY
jgi:hypothetical protein